MEAYRIQEEAEKQKDEAITPRNLHDVLNGANPTQTEMRAVNNNGEEWSPLKKCSGSSKTLNQEDSRFSGYSIQLNGFQSTCPKIY